LQLLKLQKASAGDNVPCRPNGVSQGSPHTLCLCSMGDRYHSQKYREVQTLWSGCAKIDHVLHQVSTLGSGWECLACLIHWPNQIPVPEVNAKTIPALTFLWDLVSGLSWSRTAPPPPLRSRVGPLVRETAIHLSPSVSLEQSYPSQVMAFNALARANSCTR
jgi:hypothetical protein